MCRPTAPGLVAVLTADDLDGRVRPLPTMCPEGATLAAEPHPLLPSSEVRYAGQAVVAVVAESRALAEDAAELVEVEYEPLEPWWTRARGAELMHWQAGERRGGGGVRGRRLGGERVVLDTAPRCRADRAARRAGQLRRRSGHAHRLVLGAGHAPARSPTWPTCSLASPSRST